MWKYVKEFVHRFTANPAEDGMRPDPYQFQGGTVSIEAFTDPARLPTPQAAALIDAVIAGRSDAAELRHTLMARLQSEAAPAAPSTHWQDRVASAQPAASRAL